MKKVAILSTLGGRFYGNYYGGTIFHQKEFFHDLPNRGLCPIIEKATQDALIGLPFKTEVVEAEPNAIQYGWDFLNSWKRFDFDPFLDELESRDYDGVILIHSPFSAPDNILESHQSLEEMGLYARKIILDNMCFAYAYLRIDFFNLRTGKHRHIGSKLVYEELSFDPWAESFSEIPLEAKKKILRSITGLCERGIKELIDEKFRKHEKRYEENWFERNIVKPVEQFNNGEFRDPPDDSPMSIYMKRHKEAIRAGEHLEEQKQNWRKSWEKYQALKEADS